MENNFDFLNGTWTSTQRRLREPLTGGDDWYEFPAHLRNWNVMDGAGNVDELICPTQGFSGLAVRLYDSKTDEWSIFWASSTLGMSCEPQVGRFGEDGRGIFLGKDVHKGQPVKVIYIWSDITDETARWEQAFSVDDGQTWETNWTADFRRTGK